MNNDILIDNDYYIIDNPYKDEFHIAIYYILENKCKIIVRRLDDEGWGQDLKIKIIDREHNDNFDKISLGSSEKNVKIWEIYTTINLNPIKYNETQLIPKVIIQTSNYNMNRNIYHYNSIISFVELNPEYEYKFYNDNDCRQFLIDNYKDDEDFKNIVDAFDIIIPGPIRSDLFRYAYLYKYGGCYFDCKMIIFKPLNKIIDSNDTLILCDENEDLNNCMIMIEKKNVHILEMLKVTINNIINLDKGSDSRMVSGSKRFSNIFNNLANIKKLYKNGENIFYNNDRLLKYNYKDYYKNYYNTELDVNYLWSNNKFFYKDPEIIFDYKFYFFPNSYGDTFKIKHLKNNFFIVQRLDADCGWGQQLKLKVINNKTGQLYNILIGDSNDNEKPFIIE
jgi:hypothetical protein